MKTEIFLLALSLVAFGGSWHVLRLANRALDAARALMESLHADDDEGPPPWTDE